VTLYAYDYTTNVSRAKNLRYYKLYLALGPFWAILGHLGGLWGSFGLTWHFGQNRH